MYGYTLTGKELYTWLVYAYTMSETATTTVTIDEQGRLYLPKAVRKKLGIEGEETLAEIEVRVDE